MFFLASPEIREIIVNILLGIIIVIALVLLIAFILYILKSVGTYKLLNNSGRSNIAWMAWLPIINRYAQAELSGVKENKITRMTFGIIFATLYLLNVFFLSIFSVLFLATSLAYFIMNIYLFSSFVKACGRKTNVHVVIAVLTLGISIPIQTFIFRKDTLRDLAF